MVCVVALIHLTSSACVPLREAEVAALVAASSAFAATPMRTLYFTLLYCNGLHCCAVLVLYTAHCLCRLVRFSCGAGQRNVQGVLVEVGGA